MRRSPALAAASPAWASFSRRRGPGPGGGLGVGQLQGLEQGAQGVEAHHQPLVVGDLGHEPLVEGDRGLEVPPAHLALGFLATGFDLGRGVHGAPILTREPAAVKPPAAGRGG